MYANHIPCFLRKIPLSRVRARDTFNPLKYFSIESPPAALDEVGALRGMDDDAGLRAIQRHRESMQAARIFGDVSLASPSFVSSADLGSAFARNASHAPFAAPGASSAT